MHIGVARKATKFRCVGNLKLRRPVIAIILSMQGDAYKLQGHPTSIFGKYMFVRRFEI